MDFLFGKKTSPEDMLRKNQRALNRAMRDLERERTKMEQQEKRVILDIKKMAKDGQLDAVKVMARDLVRTRRYIKKFILMRANIQAVSLKIQSMRSQNAMSEAMKGVTKAMQSMNKQLKLPQIQRIMNEFEKQTEIMDMKEEMMSDAIDDAMGADEDEEESNAVVSQILDELGIEMSEKLSGLPNAKDSISIPAASKTGKSLPQVAGIGGGNTFANSKTIGDNDTVNKNDFSNMNSAEIDADLEARLEKLRRE
ncbi:unnamed protein product [Gordionus sp. m RMFG-2023]|uniref:charged multivesicular body protein 2a-like n=1 Tax=Gordionus sp. m RMFG-2023 TaxID=3053472 RepID=UPI0030DE215D